LGFCFGYYRDQKELRGELSKEANGLKIEIMKIYQEVELTKSIKSLDDIAFLLPKGVLVQAMFCKAVHLQRFSRSMLRFYYRGIKSIRDSKKNAVRTSCVVVPRRLAVVAELNLF
jgi:hypothetical protein